MSEAKTLLAVGDISNKKIVSILDNESIKAGAAKMEVENTSSLLVLNGDNHIVGIVTEQDIVRRGVATGMNTETTYISKVMSGNPVKINHDRSIFEARNLMTTKSLNHLVVVNGELPVGILTAANILGS